MNERPILFSEPMVKAIRAGRKTMTRRICKHQNWAFSEVLDVNVNKISQKVDRNVSCPYGQPGDRLWVKETFKIIHFYPDNAQVVIEYKDGQKNIIEKYPHWVLEKNINKWKPSIFMPSAASRILLEITNIRVERLNNISGTDAISEGIDILYIEDFQNIYRDYSAKKESGVLNPLISFRTLWQSIHGKDSWDKNPYVWVITFKKIEK